MKLNVLDTIAFVLVIVGGLNWGLIAFNFNLVTFLFGSMSWLVTIVYLLVGLSAVYLAVMMPKIERRG
jgi:hypothetical protein